MSLQTLKKLNPLELKSAWFEARFPFDMAKCGHCLTFHGMYGCAEHPDFAEASKGFGDCSSSSLVKNLIEIVKLRIRFRKFYKAGIPRGFKIN